MESSGNVIVFNGEIYNYIELRNELIAKGHNFKTTSDTEVILKMYEEYGTECINKLNGMFAFLIYDKKRKQVIAARDHFGIKPLYFYKNNDTFLFASEIKALLKYPEVKAEVNQQGLNDYLTFQFILGENTLFQDIYKLSPGHFMTIDLYTHCHTLVKYWMPNFSVDRVAPADQLGNISHFVGVLHAATSFVCPSATSTNRHNAFTSRI
jgi:asparagine synthase (glutamine-hydrolysing)